MGVIYRPSDRSQQFCLGGHKNDIVSLAVSDCGRYIATGDVGLEVKVCVWDAQTGKLVRTMEKVHKRGVACMAFSPDGRFLCSVGHDENHTTCVYTTMNGEWNDGHR